MQGHMASSASSKKKRGLGGALGIAWEGEREAVSMRAVGGSLSLIASIFVFVIVASMSMLSASFGRAPVERSDREVGRDSWQGRQLDRQVSIQRDYGESRAEEETEAEPQRALLSHTHDPESLATSAMGSNMILDAASQSSSERKHLDGTPTISEPLTTSPFVDPESDTIDDVTQILRSWHQRSLAQRHEPMLATSATGAQLEHRLMMDSQRQLAEHTQVQNPIRNSIVARARRQGLMTSRQGRSNEFQVPTTKGRPPKFRIALGDWLKYKYYDPNIMRELLWRYKEPIDRKEGVDENDPSFGRPYKTCAVVGNSGMLLDSSHGARIDKHDMVMRLNNANNRGHEVDVGNKTTISFINSNILLACAADPECRCHPYGPHVPIATYVCQIIHWMDITYCQEFHESPLLVTDLRLDDLCARIVRHYSVKVFLESGGDPLNWGSAHPSGLHYSSGMQAIVLALGMCEKVSLYGFGKVPGKAHHWHSAQLGEIPEHDYAAEYAFYRDLIDGNEVPFLKDANFTLPPLEQVM